MGTLIGSKGRMRRVGDGHFNWVKRINTFLNEAIKNEVGGGTMPIVKGKYVCKISEVYDKKEGLKALKKEIRKSKRVQLQNMPRDLLEELKPLLKNKKVRIILPPGMKPSKEILQIGEVAVASPKADIYHVYKGRKVYAGGVYLPKIFFSVVPVGGKIGQVSTLEYSKCVKCMNKTFEFGWKRSKKVK